MSFLNAQARPLPVSLRARVRRQVFASLIAVVALTATLVIFVSMWRTGRTVVQSQLAQTATLAGRVGDFYGGTKGRVQDFFNTVAPLADDTAIRLEALRLLRTDRSILDVLAWHSDDRTVTIDRIGSINTVKPERTDACATTPGFSIGSAVSYQHNVDPVVAFCIRAVSPTPFVSGHFSLKRLSEFLLDVETTGKAEIFVADDAGNVVAHQNTIPVLRRERRQMPEVDSTGVLEFLLRSGDRRSNAKYDDFALDGLDLITRSKIAGTSWYAVIQRPIAEVWAPVTEIAIALLAIVLLIAVLAYAVSLPFAQRIVRPFSALTAAVRTAALARYVRPDVSNILELEDLSSEFENVVRELAAHQTDLEARIAARTLDLAHTNEKLEVVSKHKSDFLAHMSHELRTPLNAVIGFSEMLKAQYFGPLNEKQAEYVKDINDSGQHLLALINEILDLAKVESGRMELVRSNAHVPIIVEACCTLVSERFQRKRQVLDAVVEPSVSFWFMDERKFKQCLLNLLSNANKFTPEGGRVGLRVFVEEGGAPLPLSGGGIDTLVAVGSGGEGDGGGSAMPGAPFDRPPLPNPLPPGERGLAASLVVRVTDTGVGIAADALPKLFSEFYQVAATTAAPTSQAGGEGTGLGLALTKKFVELHGGTVEVTSVIGEGSVFTLRFPAGAAEATEGTGGVA